MLFQMWSDKNIITTGDLDVYVHICKVLSVHI